MQKVLIAIDYNPTSEKVAIAGKNLANTMGAEICLIHVVSEIAHYSMQYPSSFMGFGGYDIGSFDPALADEMRKVTKDYLESAAEHLNHPKISTHLAEGDAGNAILEYAKEWNADLIVMGTHSHSTLERLLVGTVASKVIEKTAIPVLMVPVDKER